MRRILISGKNVEKALDLLKVKLLFRLQEKGYGTFASTHEILGIIEEENDELKDAVRSNQPSEVKKELLDIAVGCIFSVACIEQDTIDW